MKIGCHHWNLVTCDSLRADQWVIQSWVHKHAHDLHTSDCLEVLYVEKSSPTALHLLLVVAEMMAEGQVPITKNAFGGWQTGKQE